MAQVKFKRTNNINNVPVDNGAFIVDYENQKAYIDVADNRVQFAGATVLNNQETTSNEEAYSCDYVNNKVNELDNKIDDLQYCVATISSQQTASSGYTINLNSFWVNTNNSMFSLQNGAIVIGPNVNTIKVSATIFMQDLPVNSYIWGDLVVADENGTNVLSTTCIGHGFYSGSSFFESVVMCERIIPVSEGYKVKLKADSPNGGKIRPNANQTWLQIEKIN